MRCSSSNSDADLRHGVGDRRADERLAGGAEKRLGGRVDDRDDAAPVEADHGGRNPGEHGFGEAAPAVDEVGRGGQAVVLAAQLRGHLVEGLAEMGEVALGLAHRHLGVEVAARDLVGGMDEAPDRRDEPVGEIQPEPDRREQHDQRDQREHRGEGDLDALAPAVDRQVLDRRGARDRRELDRERVHLAGDEEVCALVLRQLQHRSEHPAFAGHDADRIGRVLRLVEGFLGQGGRVLQHVDIRPGHGFVRRLDDPHHRQPERGRPRGDELVEPAPIDIEDRPGSREVVGEDADFARQALALAGRVGVGDLDGFEDDVAHLLGEPGLEAPLQGHRCDERDEDRRQGGDEAEQADDPPVQPRRRRPGEPRPNEALGLPRYHADEKQDEEAVQPEDRQDDLVRRDDRGRAGENEKRRERRPQRRDDRQRADPARAAGLRLQDAGVLAAALVDLVQTTPPIGSQEGFGGRILVAVA